MAVDTALILTRPLEVYTPEWWLKRLLLKLRERQDECVEYQKFFDGDQPLAFASAKFNQTFGSRYKRLPANFMPLVIEAEGERLIIQGFRFGAKPASDKSLWRIWQENQLDAESQIAHEIALIKGVAYAAVDPSITDGVSITIEDPAETVVETAPGNRRQRLAALKVWTDDDGHLRAYLYMPDQIFKWRSRMPRTYDYGYQNVQWQAYSERGEPWPIANRLEVVPIVPLLNRPLRDGRGRSEIQPVMGNQNAINKLRFDALVASEAVAFPQRWAVNIDIPTDPITGQPIAPWRPGADVLWTVRRPTTEEAADYGDKVPEPRLGQFPQGDLKPYIAMIEEEVGQMSSISRTPYHYFLGTPTSIPPSGESLKSSEAPLVKKVVRQALHFGEGWEELMRVAALADGQTGKARTDAETIWADPETRNEAARTDALMKQHERGLLPDEFVLEELGYSQQQIERIMTLRRAEPPAQPAPPEPPESESTDANLE